MLKICPICKSQYKTYPSRLKQGRGQTCSNKCRGLKEKSSNNPHWKGGETRQRGYVLLRRPTHPMANKSGYISRSRLAIEEHLKQDEPESGYLFMHMGEKYLRPDVRVKHLDGRRDNDAVDNLELVWIHLPKNTKQKTFIQQSP